MSEERRSTAGETRDAARDRRDFLGKVTTVAMTGGLVASYGTFFAYAGRFLYPAKGTPTAWMVVGPVERVPVGASLGYRTPAGASVVITRRAKTDRAEDFLALSSVCPHLGCQVHWEPQNDRFFCPCHNGIFDPEGQGIAGPPEGMSLLRYPLKIEAGLLYIQVPVERVAHGEPPLPERPGHDPCLGPRGAA